MANPDLSGVKVAVLVSDGFEQSEFDGPVEALRQAGARVDVLAQDEDHLERIHGVDHFDAAAGTKGDRLLAEASVDAYDGLLVPGGLASPDAMRQSRLHLDFVRRFVESGKPVAAICHGPWLLADADVAQGRALTSWPGIRRDMERAGATWEDREVVVDGNLVTSRKPEDVPAFNEAFLSRLATRARPRSERRA